MIRRTRQNSQRTRWIAAAVILLLACGAAVAGMAVAVGTLRDMWREQCRVTDRELDVVITSGKMVHPDIITLCFGLTNGAEDRAAPAEPRHNRRDRTRACRARGSGEGACGHRARGRSGRRGVSILQ